MSSRGLERIPILIVTVVAALAGFVIVGLIANGLWQPVLLFLNQTPTGTVDPIFSDRFEVPDVSIYEIQTTFDLLVSDASPFVGEVVDEGVHWIDPELVAEVGFTEWTSHGKLRHPRYVGLRDDKPAQDVRRERPEHG